VAANWAFEPWFVEILGGDQPTGVKVEQIQKHIFGTPQPEELLLFDQMLKGIFETDMPTNRDLEKMLYKQFPTINDLRISLEGDCPEILPTGSVMVGTNYSLKEYTNAFLQDLIDRHISDMNTVLGKHYDGGVDSYIGPVFNIKLSEDVLICELENLILTGSDFHCNGYDIRMLPVIF
jgi:hypothetical protein